MNNWEQLKEEFANTRSFKTSKIITEICFNFATNFLFEKVQLSVREYKVIRAAAESPNSVLSKTCH